MARNRQTDCLLRSPYAARSLYNGVTFAVNSFRAGISDEYGGTIGELVKRGAYEPDYYQNHLRKIHIEEGVRNISVSLAHYASLEEIHIANPADCHSITMNLWTARR